MFTIQMLQSLSAIGAIVMILIGCSWIKQAALAAIR